MIIFDLFFKPLNPDPKHCMCLWIVAECCPQEAPAQGLVGPLQRGPLQHPGGGEGEGLEGGLHHGELLRPLVRVNNFKDLNKIELRTSGKKRSDRSGGARNWKHWSERSAQWNTGTGVKNMVKNQQRPKILISRFLNKFFVPAYQNNGVVFENCTIY